MRFGVSMRAVSGAALTVALAAGVAAQTAVRTGQVAPDFAGTTTDGKKVRLSQFRGKSAVLLNFYANF